MKIKIILPVRHIPDGTIVTKVGGTVQFKLHKKAFRILPYLYGGDYQHVEPPEGGGFLLPVGGTKDAINTVLPDRQMQIDEDILKVINILGLIVEEETEEW
jgi:hypothetical protein